VPHSGQRKIRKEGLASGSSPVPPHRPQPTLIQASAEGWHEGRCDEASFDSVRCWTVTPSPMQVWQDRLVDPGSARPFAGYAFGGMEVGDGRGPGMEAFRDRAHRVPPSAGAKSATSGRRFRRPG